MVRERRLKERQKTPDIHFGSGDSPLASNVGALLLDLRNALQQAERCRLALKALGYSQTRWQEIVRDVDRDLRFVLRPQILDAIITHLQSVGGPVHRQELVRDLNAQGAGIPQRIKQSITQNLRAGNLMLYAGNKIGLPTWKGKISNCFGSSPNRVDPL
jgi:hypothetical protein